LLLRAVLFNTFLHDLGDGRKCSLTRFVDDAKVGGMVDTLDGCATIRGDLERLEKQESKIKILLAYI